MLTVKQLGNELDKIVGIVAQNYNDQRSYPIYIIVKDDGTLDSANFQEIQSGNCGMGTLSEISGPDEASNWYYYLVSESESAALELYADYVSILDQ